MTIEGKEGLGSMYGVVDSMRNMTRAMEELLEFLPQDYVWPTNVNVSPFSVYAEWGRDSSKDPDGGVRLARRQLRGRGDERELSARLA